MDVTVLSVPDCPHVAVLEQRLEQALAEYQGVTVSREVVADEMEAARRGMHGSPTILVNGFDPFAEPGMAPSNSCRLYRTREGEADGAPTVGQLKQALAAAAQTPAE